MRLATLLILGGVLFIFGACDGTRSNRPAGVAQNRSSELADTRDSKLAEKEVPSTKQIAGIASQNTVSTQPISLKDADSANVASQAFDRKIIRNATLVIEVKSATDSQQKVVSIAEVHQGFVVTSEATQLAANDKTKQETTINLVVRVPAAQFNPVMEEIRAVGVRIVQEKVNGQDVTEEFMDLEARIKNQKALESQFLEIMKRAGKVDDALNVQTQLAEVRTEIEKLEGRRRFLTNQASLSTITVTLQPPAQIVNATGFWYSVRSAFSDGVDVAEEIVLFLIRAVIAVLPVMLFILLPLALIGKIVVKIIRRRRANSTEATANA